MELFDILDDEIVIPQHIPVTIADKKPSEAELVEALTLHGWFPLQRNVEFYVSGMDGAKMKTWQVTFFFQQNSFYIVEVKRAT